MRKRSMASFLLVVIVGFSWLGCPDKGSLPSQRIDSMASVPEGQSIVIDMNFSSVLGFLKSLKDALPPEMQPKIPPIEQGLEMFKTSLGIDLSQIKQILFSIRGEDEKSMLVVAEGLAVELLKGNKIKEIEGRPLFELQVEGDRILATSLDQDRTLLAMEERSLQASLQAFLGRGKRLKDSDKKEMFSKLIGTSPELNTIRIYLIDAKTGEKEIPITINGGAFYLNMNRGFSILVLSDEASAKQIEDQLKVSSSVVGELLENQLSGIPTEAIQLAKKMMEGMEVTREGGVVQVDLQKNWDAKAIAGILANLSVSYAEYMTIFSQLLKGEGEVVKSLPAGTEDPAKTVMFGLKLKPHGKWKSFWDEEANVAKWENTLFNAPVEIRLLAQKFNHPKEFTNEAPQLDFLNEKSFKIGKPHKTPKGFWVEAVSKKQKKFFMIQNVGKQQFLCSARMGKIEGSKARPIPRPLALKLCNSISAAK